MQDLEPVLLHGESTDGSPPESKASVDEDGWAELPAPQDNPLESASTHTPSNQTNVDLDDERAQLEAELARIDAEWDHRDTTPTATSSPPDAALADLESRLSNIEF